MDCYIDWREGADAVAYAYRQWADAPEALRGDRFRSYVAALDHEEFAAIAYALAVATVARRMQRGRGRKTKK